MNRIHELEADIRGLEEENNNVAEGNQLLTRIRDFTNAIAGKLDDMSFHEKQTLARTILSEVLIDGDTVKLLFKIPLPKVKKTSLSKTNTPPSGALSKELDLRSHRDDSMNVRIPFQRRSKRLNDGDHSWPRVGLIRSCRHHLADGLVGESREIS